MEFYPEQAATMFGPERSAFTEASTKSGKTTVALAWLYDYAIRPYDQNTACVWWVAPVYSQARIAFNRMRAALKGQPGFKSNFSIMQITCPHNVTMEFKSGDNPDNLYGQNVMAAVIDEASRIKGESIDAVRSTLSATRGPWRLIGNVRGMGNEFYQMCRKAERGELPNTTYHKIDAYLAASYSHQYPGLPDLKEIENAKAMLPEKAFRELYMVDPSGNDTNPFGIDAISACVAPLSPGGCLLYTSPSPRD